MAFYHRSDLWVNRIGHPISVPGIRSIRKDAGLLLFYECNPAEIRIIVFCPSSHTDQRSKMKKPPKATAYVKPQIKRIAVKTGGTKPVYVKGHTIKLHRGPKKT